MDVSSYRKISDFFKALSHPTRVEMVEELLKGEKCVSDIKGLVEIRQPNTSQHLAILKASNIVDCYKGGKRKCYFLKDPKLMRDILELLKVR